MYRRVVYSSKAAEGVSMRDAYDIIRVSHNRNSQSGLTGGLILIDGYFFQLLEGLPAAVEERYGRISQDARHYDVTTRLDETAESALFESDWMALRDGTAIGSELLEEHNYKPGMPEDEFSSDQLVSFMLAAFEKSLSEI